MQKVSFELEVYSFHIDFIGHVNNTVYVQWMEIGRTKLLEEVGMPTHEIFEQGVAPVLVQTNITYKSPLYLGDRVRAEMWISELRNASAIMHFHFYNQQGILAATGWQKGLFVDRETMRPRRLQSSERALFEPYVYSNIAAQPTPEMAGIS
ncbi:MAG TPA: acyl-CoA thioesterase [Leptolyngbyaceae cyanobacterium M33_DOE_097]|uniref:Acyl-CoA thioesterase n=1 Tax=Oscillatoriales cyanobacterium SpSt-418 TaxID=2282169 RepID=A0A7C3PDH3_9CYAN|nr:acyl-CoA thioesterase [Leptolyngbyaceae cyanobacterium M33_DOE_097]